MKFGKYPLVECGGAVLSHSIKFDENVRLKKGKLLAKADLEGLANAGYSELLVAKLELNDIGENEAATQIAQCLEGSTVRAAKAGTGRVNLYAKAEGVFCASKELVNQINAIHPDITLATLPDKARVSSGIMVATVKIIPYAVDAVNVENVIKVCSDTVISVVSFKAMKIGVVLSDLPTLKDSVKKKTINALEKRLDGTGSKIEKIATVAHEQNAIEQGIADCAKNTDMVIVFGASAISDIGDLIPQALLNLGGAIERFGMPVDPGNLLLLGSLNGKTIIGAPGCSRSIAENGFDFVLHRVLSGLEITSSDIAKMGVGGLLLEIPTRPSPRENVSNTETNVSAVVLAAGQSKRMGEENKLLAELDGKPLVRHVVEACEGSGVSSMVLVTGHESDLVKKVVAGSTAQTVENPNFADGLSTSLKAGISDLGDEATHALVLLGDMPKITSDMIDKMIATANSSPIGSIIMATTNGKRGNPILWPRQYFDRLLQLTGDVGAKHILYEFSEQIVEVELGEAAALDVDTKTELKTLGGNLPTKK